MKALNHYSSYEAFEAEMARELGLSMGFDRIRAATAGWPLARATNSAKNPPAATQLDFEARYRACKTAAERVAFVRANKEEAKRFLRNAAKN